MQFNSVSVEFF